MSLAAKWKVTGHISPQGCCALLGTNLILYCFHSWKCNLGKCGAFSDSIWCISSSVHSDAAVLILYWAWKTHRKWETIQKAKAVQDRSPQSESESQGLHGSACFLRSKPFHYLKLKPKATQANLSFPSYHSVSVISLHLHRPNSTNTPRSYHYSFKGCNYWFPQPIHCHLLYRDAAVTSGPIWPQGKSSVVVC